MSILDKPYDIFSLKRQDFLKTAKEVYAYQLQENKIFRAYVHQIGQLDKEINRITDFVFLPIQFFKTHQVTAFDEPHRLVFESSTTSGQMPSKHFIKDEELYKTSLLESFQSAFGQIQNYTILALLPHYLERENSSLVYMAKELMDKSGQPNNGFYLNNQKELFEQLQELENEKKPTILLGVTFALLDFAERYSIQLNTTTIIETGGMKGRKEEMSREEVHARLKKSFGNKPIASEYGMAELLSQSYLTQKPTFETPAWKKVIIRDMYDPFELNEIGKGALNIIDLTNIYSCSFIATDDIGECLNDDTFYLKGRLDSSEIRGCNLLLNSI